MTRGNPERIYAAQRSGILRRLVDQERVPAAKAEALLAEWEREAEVIGAYRGSALYWDIAWDWITERLEPPEIDTTTMSAEGDDGQVFGG